MSLFNVGEEVILHSKTYPHLNGNAVVVEVLTAEEKEKRIKMVHPLLSSSKNTGYILDIPAPQNEHFGILFPPGISNWAESALRKKYKPGKKFDTLVDELKSGRPVSA